MKYETGIARFRKPVDLKRKNRTENERQEKT